MAEQVISLARPPLVAYQNEIIDNPERFTCVEASTKSGKTACMIFWLLREAWKCKANQSVYWVAPIYMQARIAFDRMRNQISDISGNGGERSIFTVNESRLTLTLPNKAIIEFKSADNPDSLYGNDCYAVVVDEASRVSEAAWIAVRSTLTATNGPAKLIGNVKGRLNFFYKMCAKAKAGEPGYYYRKITCWDAVDAGILARDEIEDAQRSLPENVFKELFLADASEDGSNPFNLNMISRCVYPISDLPPVCFGVDLAKSHDWTVITGLDRNGGVCYFSRFQKDWKQTIEEIIGLPPGIVCLDATGVGDSIGEQIARVRETKLFVFTQKSKQMIMEALAVAIQSRSITVLEGIMKDELDSFEFEFTRSGVHYTAPSGLHDDCVCSLALAVHVHRDSAGSGQYSVY